MKTSCERILIGLWRPSDASPFFFLPSSSEFKLDLPPPPDSCLLNKNSSPKIVFKIISSSTATCFNSNPNSDDRGNFHMDKEEIVMINDSLSDRVFFSASHFLASYSIKQGTAAASIRRREEGEGDAGNSFFLTPFQAELLGVKWILPVWSGNTVLRESLRELCCMFSFDESRCRVLMKIKKKRDAKFIHTSQSFFNKPSDPNLEEVMLEVVPVSN